MRRSSVSRGRISTPARRTGGSSRCSRAVLVRAVEHHRRREAHVDRRGRVDDEGRLAAHADADDVGWDPGHAGVGARCEDGRGAQLAEGVVARVLGGAEEVVRHARAEVDRRVEEPRQHLHADADLELGDRLVREPPAEHRQDGAAERDERVALRAALGVAEESGVGRVHAAGDGELLRGTPSVRPRDRRDGQKRRRPAHLRERLDERGPRRGRARRQRAPRVRVAVVDPRPVEEKARRRFDHAGRVVPDGPEVVGARHEGPAASERPHPAVGHVDPRSVPAPRCCPCAQHRGQDREPSRPSSPCSFHLSSAFPGGRPRRTARGRAAGRA